jgi:putative DNA primase/helicase
MLKPIYENMPSELKVIPQWVNWKNIERDGRMTKPPFQINGALAKSDDPLTWSSFDDVQKAAYLFDGVGVVLTDNDDNVFLDFDKCRCPAFDGIDDEISGGLNIVLPEVAEHIRRLNSYTELSPTGKGIHVFLKGKLPVKGKRKGNFEVYQSGRYSTMTGHVVKGFPRAIEHRQESLDAFYQVVFGSYKNPVEPEKPAVKNVPTGDRNVILEKAFNSKSGDKIKRLWNGDFTDYNSQSEADLALCSHLAFWFNGDTSAIDDAFHESGLMREKWNEKHYSDGQSYGEATISKAITGCKLFCGADETVYGDVPNVRSNVSGKIDHLRVAKDVVADLGRENLAYVSNIRIFRQWDGGVWNELDDRSINGAIVKYLDGNTQGVTKNIIESITDLIRIIVFRQDVIWDADMGVIPVQNGELALDNGHWTLNPHIREHYRTTLIPVEYDQLARAPRFEQFLEEIFQNEPDVIEKSILVYEMIGYTLTTSCEYEKFILLIGVGANGKSVLLDVIIRLVGPKQVAAVQPEQMDNTFQRAHLCGKLANIVTEIKEGGVIADAALKSITSGELTTAEHKFKKPFDFKPFSTCWFGTNHMPHTRDFSDALFRRALIVEFNRVFQEHEQDKQLKRKLAAELPGILNLALDAFAGVIQRGHFTIPASCKRAKEEWRIEADQVAQFIKDCCEMERNASISSGTLYNAYKCWASDAGIQKILNKNSFSRRVQRLGGKRGRDSHFRFMEGIRLKDFTQEKDE